MEALGGGASVIGVASLAIQVCEELKKVHDFWQSVKEAPDDIKHISTEVNLFMTWLAVIANNYQRQGFDPRSPNHIAAADTLKICLATVREMKDGIEDLESRFSAGTSSRRWASVKFVFRKDRTEKVIKQIERMKTLLLIVQTCFIGDMQESGFRLLSMSLRPKDSVLQAASHAQTLYMSTAAATNERLDIGSQELQVTPTSSGEMASANLKASPPTISRPRLSTTRQEARAYNFGLAMLRFISTEQQTVLSDGTGVERRIPARQSRYDFRLAQWLLSRGFSWQSFSKYGSWQYSFRTFRYIPQDSLIVDFCMDGDLANVQRMFDRGLASPFDRVDRGKFGDWSLLHYSANGCHAPLCRFLINCGLGRGSASGMSGFPILTMPGLPARNSTIYSSSAHLDTLRIMVEEGQYDPMEADKCGDTVMHYFDGPPAVFQWLLDQEEFSIDLNQSTLLFKSVAKTLLYITESNTSHYLEAVFSHKRGLKIPAESSVFSVEQTLACEAVSQFSYLVDKLDYPHHLRVLCDAGADLHASRPYFDSGTMLNELFKSAIHRLITKRGEDGIGYDRLENISTDESRSRISKSLWKTWYPGDELSVLEVVQRYLDAWMEVLLEAGIDIAEYGRREEELHPEGVLSRWRGEARVVFEYGDHVDGCRIHVTEIYDPDDESSTSGEDDQSATSREDDQSTVYRETSTMPCSWDFDDE